ncbi:MAG: FAD-dependent oxidoreductase, partial [Lachnospiraceae bacterium]|nr:FAD-dependent oxidoreductase [Lachnospiraceae bacterium]
LDSPIAIDEIKKFIADQDLNAQNRYIPKKRHEYGNKIAIVGAGPAGLSCAFFLALDGYQVTVFEKQKALGGMLTLGIPAFRLEKNVVNAEIEVLKELGVNFKTGIEVGKDITLDELRKDGYEAFYLAVGAQGGRGIGIEGEDAKGVLAGVDFVRRINLGEDVTLEGDTIVIGGGNVAIDVARNAVRTGTGSVSMYCLESRNEMPALEEEIEEALEEKIQINNSWGPKRIVTEHGKVTGVEFKKCVSVFDENKRFKPVYDENDTIIVKADNVILSVGQTIEWGSLLEGSNCQLNPNGTLKADSLTYQTDQKDVFTGGDSFTGPRFAIDAIAAGKQGAISIHRFVQPGQSLIIGRSRREYHALDKEQIDFEGYDRVARQSVKHVEQDGNKDKFKDPRLTFTEEQVQKETQRCLSCGATVVNEYMCVGCGSCTTKCKFDAISLVRVYDGQGVAYEDLKPVVVKQVIKRKGRIAVRKAKDLFVKG